MSAVPKFPLPTPRLRPRRSASAPPSRARLVATSPRSTVRSLPVTRSTPKWLRLLILTQRSSSIVTFALVGLTLAVYGWTVYAQELWGRQYRQLEALQRQERQLTTANEALKQNLAQQAEQPNSRLTAPNPSSMIFLQPAAPRPTTAPATSSATPLAPNRPLAY
ncbi:MAG: hypothetical protein F6K28_26435 [Microcoleus sp. SIO2G3]|nr:hypothetical protein [Microcoleus sp. SIO2G3]